MIKRKEEEENQWKVDRELANYSLSSTASQGTSNIPFPWFFIVLISIILGYRRLSVKEFLNPGTLVFILVTVLLFLLPCYTLRIVWSLSSFLVSSGDFLKKLFFLQR